MKKIRNNFLESSEQKLSSLLGLYKAQRYDEAEKLALSITQEFSENKFEPRNHPSFSTRLEYFQERIAKRATHARC